MNLKPCSKGRTDWAQYWFIHKLHAYVGISKNGDPWTFETRQSKGTTKIKDLGRHKDKSASSKKISRVTIHSQGDRKAIFEFPLLKFKFDAPSSGLSSI